MKLTETWWYQLPAPFAHYEINDEGILRNTSDGELVSTYTYWSMQGPNGEEIPEELYALANDKGVWTGNYNSEELVERFLMWKAYDIPRYEVSKCGLLRKASDKTPVLMQYTPRGTGYYEIPYYDDNENQSPEEFLLLTPFDLCDVSFQRKLFILNHI